MTSNVLITVLLPVYNGEKFIREAVESILAQTYEKFELIIIDDGSTDNTLSILKELEKIDFRIKLISRENKGLIATLNEGAEIANGEWIVRMDADDISMPTRLERQLNWVSQTESDISGTWVRFFGAHDVRIWKGYQSDQAIKVDMLFKCPLVHPSIIIRTSLLRTLKYDLNSEKAEDYDLWVRAAIFGAKITNMPEVLLKYRQHPMQVTTVSKKSQEEMTIKIRDRYWQHFLTSQNIALGSAEVNHDSINLWSPKINEDLATEFFLNLANKSNEETRIVLLNNIFKLSIYNQKISQVWKNLDSKYGKKPRLIKQLLLVVCSLTPNVFLKFIIVFIKKIYFSVYRK